MASPTNTADLTKAKVGEDTATVPMPLALDIEGVSKALSIGKTKVYEEIAAGRLEARRAGGRTLIPSESVRAWLASLPRIQSAVPAA